jgi:hypothetical protein
LGRSWHLPAGDIPPNPVPEEGNVGAGLATTVLGYVRSFSNLKIGLKDLKTVDFVSRFKMIIESANFESRILLKVRISMQNQRFPNPSNHFFDLKGYERNPPPTTSRFNLDQIHTLVSLNNFESKILACLVS